MRKAAHGLAKIHRERLASDEGHDHVLLGLTLERIEASAGGDDGLGERVCRVERRRRRFAEHFLGDAAHLSDVAAQVLELGIVGADDVCDMSHPFPIGRLPKRPVT